MKMRSNFLEKLEVPSGSGTEQTHINKPQKTNLLTKCVKNITGSERVPYIFHV
jgi:hypothetical protein